MEFGDGRKMTNPYCHEGGHIGAAAVFGVGAIPSLRTLKHIRNAKDSILEAISICAGEDVSAQNIVDLGIALQILEKTEIRLKQERLTTPPHKQ